MLTLDLLRSLAWAEMYITIARIFAVKRWEDLELDAGEDDVRLVRDCVVGEVHPKSKGVKLRSRAVQKPEALDDSANN